MIYLIDSDALISAHRRYYKIPHFPSFWKWLEKQFVTGAALSIENVKNELMKGEKEDALKVFIKKNVMHFISTSSEEDQQNFRLIVNFANKDYEQSAALNQFLDGADIFLIAKALTLKDSRVSVVVVTNEQSSPNTRTKVKIPDVCNHFEIDTVTFFEFIYNLNIKI